MLMKNVGGHPLRFWVFGSTSCKHLRGTPFAISNFGIICWSNNLGGHLSRYWILGSYVDEKLTGIPLAILSLWIIYHPLRFLVNKLWGDTPCDSEFRDHMLIKTFRGTPVSISKFNGHMLIEKLRGTPLAILRNFVKKKLMGTPLRFGILESCAYGSLGGHPLSSLKFGIHFL